MDTCTTYGICAVYVYICISSDSCECGGSNHSLRVRSDGRVQKPVITAGNPTCLVRSASVTLRVYTSNEVPLCSNEIPREQSLRKKITALIPLIESQTGVETEDAKVRLRNPEHRPTGSPARSPGRKVAQSELRHIVRSELESCSIEMFERERRLPNRCRLSAHCKLLMNTAPLLQPRRIARPNNARGGPGSRRGPGTL